MRVVTNEGLLHLAGHVDECPLVSLLSERLGGRRLLAWFHRSDFLIYPPLISQIIFLFLKKERRYII